MTIKGEMPFSEKALAPIIDERLSRKGSLMADTVMSEKEDGLPTFERGRGAPSRYEG